MGFRDHQWGDACVRRKRGSRRATMASAFNEGRALEAKQRAGPERRWQGGEKAAVPVGRRDVVAVSL
eukprot:6193487-Pleurochrysis_carterae.AAC.2